MKVSFSDAVAVVEIDAARRAEMAQVGQQVAQMQVLSKEALALSGKSATPLITMSKENIETALARNGLKPQSVMLTGDYAKVQLAAASFAGTLNWLDDMQKNALVSVVDANIVRWLNPIWSMRY